MRVKDVAIFVSIFVDDSLVFVEQFINRKIDIGRLCPFKITLGTIMDILVGNGVFICLQELVFHDILNLVNLDILWEAIRNLCDNAVTDTL
ncbi:Uncharacterised protein [Chlamydia trachomatis]|nr:Uncharacterised protein [Chlamydia trachomatis]